MELIKEEYNWSDQDVIGLSLLIVGGSIDSFGNDINGDVFYTVGKHKQTGRWPLSQLKEIKSMNLSIAS